MNCGKIIKKQEVKRVTVDQTERTPQPTLTILLADDDQHIRSALQLLVSQYPSMKIVGEAGNINELLAGVWATHPRLILLDWELPGGVDPPLIAWLHTLDPPPYILACSSWPEAEAQARAAGADAFVSKARPAAELLQTLLQITSTTSHRK